MAWKFNESNQWVTMADAAPLTLTVPWTVAGWIKLDDNVGSLFQYFCSWNEVGIKNSFNWFFVEGSHATDADDMRATILGNSAFAISLDSDDNAGADAMWMHVVLRVTSSGPTGTIHKNATVIDTDIDVEFDTINHTGLWNFGRRSDANVDRYLGGEMAEWAKWDRALSDEEIALLAAGYAPSVLPIGLAWYVPMIRDYTEIVGGLTVVNQGSTIAAHPPIRRPVGPYITFTAASPAETPADEIMAAIRPFSEPLRRVPDAVAY